MRAGPEAPRGGRRRSVAAGEVLALAAALASACARAPGDGRYAPIARLLDGVDVAADLQAGEQANSGRERPVHSLARALGAEVVCGGAPWKNESEPNAPCEARIGTHGADAPDRSFRRQRGLRERAVLPPRRALRPRRSGRRSRCPRLRTAAGGYRTGRRGGSATSSCRGSRRATSRPDESRCLRMRGSASRSRRRSGPGRSTRRPSTSLSMRSSPGQPRSPRRRLDPSHPRIAAGRGRRLARGPGGKACASGSRFARPRRKTTARSSALWADRE
jgi:hypothetical protein